MRAGRAGLLVAGAVALIAAPLLVQAGEETKKEKRVEIIEDDGTRAEDGTGEGARHFEFFGEGMGGGRLGVGLAEVTKDDVGKLGLAEERGALVKSVEEGSAAAKAGIEAGDVIVRFQGEAVSSAAALARMVRETPAGRTVGLEVIRKGAIRKLTATLSEPRDFEVFVHRGMPPHPPMPPMPPMPEMGATPPGHSPSQNRMFRWKSDESDEPDLRILHSSEPPRLGVTLQDVEGQLAAYFGVAGKGVLVTSVEEASAAAKAGVKAGDIIQKLAGTAVASSAELRRAVRKAEGGKPLALSILRGGKPVELSVTLPQPDKPRHTGRSI